MLHLPMLLASTNNNYGQKFLLNTDERCVEKLLGGRQLFEFADALDVGKF